MDSKRMRNIQSKASHLVSMRHWFHKINLLALSISEIRGKWKEHKYNGKVLSTPFQNETCLITHTNLDKNFPYLQTRFYHNGNSCLTDVHVPCQCNKYDIIHIDCQARMCVSVSSEHPNFVPFKNIFITPRRK